MSTNLKFVQAQAFTIAGAGAVTGDTTVDLSSFKGIDGSLLTMANFGSKGFMTFEPNSGSQEEQISFTGVTQNANGTATLTGISTVLFISPYTETTGFSKSHAGGVLCVVSNTSGFYNSFANRLDDETILQTWTFTLPNYPRMDSVVIFPTDPEQFVPKAYADSLAFNGAPNASTSVQGLVQEATVAQLNAGTATGSTGALLFGSPADFAASIYGIQLPTSGQKSALVGDNTDIAVGSGNKYVTQTGLIHGAEKYATTTGSANAYVAALSPVPISLTNGMTITLIANFSCTGASTLAVNGLGSTPAITKRGTNALISGDIVSGEAFTVTWDGTRWQLQSPSAIAPVTAAPVYKTGQTTHDMSSTTTQNIAHGLGAIPKLVTINCNNNTSQIICNSQGAYDGSSDSCVWQVQVNGASGGGGPSGNVLEAHVDVSTNYIVAVATVDATNIILSFTKTGTPTGTANIQWTATT